MSAEIQKSRKPHVIIILDGWGLAPVWGGNAIAMAKIVNFDTYAKKYPYTTLLASGPAVGLPENCPGNSEAGHLNIGAGEIVHQDQPLIDSEIGNGTFDTNEVLLGAFSHAVENNSNLHIMGLLSKTGTHAHINHLFALLKLANQQKFDRVYIHLFTDGRDSDSMSGIEMLSEVNFQINALKVGQVSSAIGRYFAMDRDNNWDRIEKAYNLLTVGTGTRYESAGAIFTASYSAGKTDEFIEPSVVISKDRTPMFIGDNDSVIFFNFRSDRAKEITRAFLDPQLPEMPNRHMLKNLYFATFVIHADDQLAKQAFYPPILTQTLAEVWSQHKLRQFHIAETEKYAHVTYFFNGGTEKPVEGEDRLMIPSPKSVKTYDLMPEMSARTVAEEVVATLDKNIYDAMVINFANADMVGHTGDLKATIKAVEVVDECLGDVVEKVLAENGTAYVFADHGNAEQMVSPKTGYPDTEHTCNPVPFMIINNQLDKSNLLLRKDGILASIAPTVLELMMPEFDYSNKQKSLIIKQ
ncbi:MAG: 2,3-bisphosphoglycerate-independent phosphoglycerate mutase [Candidatus Berkelbacteria bacterium]